MDWPHRDCRGRISSTTAIKAAAMFDEGAHISGPAHSYHLCGTGFISYPRRLSRVWAATGIHNEMEVISCRQSAPRHMFAGARLKWHRPLIIGRPAGREVIVRNIVLSPDAVGRWRCHRRSQNLPRSALDRTRVSTESRAEFVRTITCVSKKSKTLSTANRGRHCRLR